MAILNLQADAELLMFKEYKVPGVKLLRQLGAGASCIAFEACTESLGCPSDRVVCKIFRQNDMGATSYRNEVQALSLLKRAEVTHVPRILTWLDDLGAPQTTDGEAVLLVSPVGRPVANVKATMNRISGRNLVQLIAVLQKAHGLGLRHRDIKPENIFLDEDGNLVLIDWGCSVINCQQPIPWAGTRLYATPVPGLHAHIPTPEDDLKLAIRSAFVLATAWLPLHPSDESWITAMGTNTFWEEMSQFARFGNYDKLSDLLAKMIGTLSEVKFAEK
jgi:hypothetical protein